MSEIVIVEPLSGEEIVKRIQVEVERALYGDCYLNRSFGYEKFWAKVTITLRLTDNNAEKMVERVAEIGVMPTGGTVKTVTREIVEAPPNAVRKEAGLGIPTLVKKPGGESTMERVKYAEREGKWGEPERPKQTDV